VGVSMSWEKRTKDGGSREADGGKTKPERTTLTKQRFQRSFGRHAGTTEPLYARITHEYIFTELLQ